MFDFAIAEKAGIARFFPISDYFTSAFLASAFARNFSI